MNVKSGYQQPPDQPPSFNPNYDPAPPPPYPGGQYPPQQSYAPVQLPYGQAGGVTTQQPTGTVYNAVAMAPPMSNPPNDYLCFNILVTICCCWPIGIFAILKSVESRDAVNHGDRTRAESSSREARRCGIVTLFVGIAMAVITSLVSAFYIYTLTQELFLNNYP